MLEGRGRPMNGTGDQVLSYNRNPVMVSFYLPLGWNHIPCPVFAAKSLGKYNPRISRLSWQTGVSISCKGIERVSWEN